MQIKAAKSWGYLPTSIIRGKQKSGQPGKWDLLLAHAEQVVEMERCPQCGNPRYICQSEDPDIEFRVFDETCEAMRAKAFYEERKKDSKNRQGVAVGTEAFTWSRVAFGEFRAPFYEQRMTEREVREKERPIREREYPPGETPQSDDQ